MKTQYRDSILALALLVLAGLGCNAITEGKPAAEAGISRFHQMYNQGRFAEIYDISDDEMKEASSEDDLLELLDAVRDQHGDMKETSNNGFSFKTNNGVTRIEMNQTTTYERGATDERFIFVLHGDEAKLAGYHVKTKKASK